MLEIAQKWTKAKDRRRVTKRVLKTVEYADGEKEAHVFTDDHERFDEDKIKNLSCNFCMCSTGSTNCSL